jgi:hypothetical protein
VDSVSSHHNEPFKKTYTVANLRHAPAQGGFQSPSQGSSYQKRPNHANFHKYSRGGLDQSNSYNSPRIQVESSKYSGYSYKMASHASTAARRFTYNQTNTVYRSPGMRGPSYTGSQSSNNAFEPNFEQSSFLGPQSGIARVVPDSSISGASRGASNLNQRGGGLQFWGS